MSNSSTRKPTLASPHFNSKRLAKIFEELLTKPQLHAIENEQGAIHYVEVPGAPRLAEDNPERLELAGKVLAYSLTLMEYELSADARETVALLSAQRSTHDPAQGYS